MIEASEITHVPAGRHGVAVPLMDRKVWDADEDGFGEVIDPFGHDWFALQTLPRKERRTRQDVVRAFAGFGCLLPVDKHWRRPSRYCKRHERHDRPLIPRYVFLAVPAGHSVPWFDLLELETVTGVIGIDGQPARLDRRGAQSLIRFRDTGRFQHPEKVRVEVAFGQGDSVQVTGGPLRGMVAEVESVLTAKARARLVFEGAGGGVEVPLEILRKAA